MKNTIRNTIISFICLGSSSAFAVITTPDDISDSKNRDMPSQVDQQKSTADNTQDKMKSKKMHQKSKMHEEKNDNSMNNKPIGTTTGNDEVNTKDAVNGKKY
jgi:hypothetical protein